MWRARRRRVREASLTRSDDEAIHLRIERRSDKAIGPSRRHPEGRWGLWTISSFVVVEDGQASPSSSCLDLASQAPSAYIIVFMGRSTEADPRLQAEGFGGCRIEFDYAAGLRRGGGLQAAVGRARLDRLTSAWRPNPRHRLNVAHLPSLGTSPIVPPFGDFGDLRFA